MNHSAFSNALKRKIFKAFSFSLPSVRETIRLRQKPRGISRKACKTAKKHLKFLERYVILKEKKFTRR